MLDVGPLEHGAAIAKPALRGVLHHRAAWFTAGAGSVLVAIAPSVRSAVAAAVYALSLVILFTVSAIYHQIDWSPVARARMRRADHASIFFLIAGTYTPIALLGVGGSAGQHLLIAIWSGAAIGVLLSLLGPTGLKVLRAVTAVGVGWTIVPYVNEVRRTLSAPELWLILAGGVAYTLGAVVYAAKRPNPRPGVFGYHEVFHALTLVGAALHFAAVLQIVRSATR